jgi:hypothetical protein
MTEPLGQLVAHTRYLLLDFDGPICDIFAGLPAPTVADHLRKVITSQDATLPDEIAQSPDPIEVFKYSATVSPGLAALVENEMADQELAAVASAKPTPYSTTSLPAPVNPAAPSSSATTPSCANPTLTF